MNKFVAVATCSLVAISVAACSKKAPEELPPPPPSQSAPAVSQPVATQSGVRPGSQADFVAQMRGRDTILFDTDKYDIDETDAAALRSQAEWLARYPDKRARIEGHADERGTRDYNLALGERRANAAKNYLATLGVNTSRLTVVSYGEERPANTGSNQAAWSQNRRAVTVTID